MVHYSTVATHCVPVVVSLGLVLGATIAGVTQAADFRVHTTVVAQGETKPLSRNLTVFADQRIYDFPLDGSREATIFDTSADRFTLLDGQRQLQCHLTGKELLRVVDAIEQRARETRNPRIRFAADPSFHETFDAKNRQLTLASEHLTYVVVGTRPEWPAAAEQFREFADWFARLNAIRYPQPPSARLRLNEALWEHKMVPARVSREVPEWQTCSSKHVFAWRLDDNDQQRVRMAQDWSRKFREVPREQFQKPATASSASSSPR